MPFPLIDRRRFLTAIAGLGIVLSVPAVSFAASPPLRIGVSAGPYGEILDFAAKIADQEDLKVEIVEFTEWTVINAALQSGDIDANNFQHIPYLNAQISARGYDIVPLQPSIVVPMGIYAGRIKGLDTLPDGATIGIPNDPTNSARALKLLELAGLIRLKPDIDQDAASPLDIADNPRHLRFSEIDAAQLPRTLPDIDLGVITLNYAVLAGLDPKAALKLEDETSHWTLVWAARRDRAQDARLVRFIEIYRSAAVRDFVLERFKGSILPTW